MWQDVIPELVVGVTGGAIGWGAKALNDRRKLRKPLKVSTDEDPRVIYLNDPPWVSFPQFVPEDSASISAPPSDALAWGEWARDLGGMSAGYAELQVTLSSRVSAAVVVEGLRVQVVDTCPIPPGTVVHQPVGGPDLIRRGFEVKLGDFVSHVQAVEAGSGEPTSNYSFSLAASETARLSIRVRPECRDVIYTWRAELVMSVNGKRGIQPVGSQKATYRLCGRLDPWCRSDGQSWTAPGSVSSSGASGGTT